MKATFRPCTIALVASLVAAPAFAEGVEAPRPEKDYSADVVTTMSGLPGMGEMSINGSVKYDSESQRYRRSQNAMGMDSVMIIDVKNESTTLLLPASKQYMEQGKEEAAGSPNAGDVRYLSFDEVGKEEVNGIDTTKYAVAFDENSKGHLWLTKEKIAVRTEGTMSQQGQTFQFREELSNLELAEQDDSNFEIPADYELMAMPGLPSAGGEAPADPFAGMSDEEKAEMQRQLQEQMKKVMEQMEQGQQSAQ